MIIGGMENIFEVMVEECLDVEEVVRKFRYSVNVEVNLKYFAAIGKGNDSCEGM